MRKLLDCFVTTDQKMRCILDVAEDTYSYDRALVWLLEQ